MNKDYSRSIQEGTETTEVSDFTRHNQVKGCQKGKPSHFTFERHMQKKALEKRSSWLLFRL